MPGGKEPNIRPKTILAGPLGETFLHFVLLTMPPRGKEENKYYHAIARVLIEHHAEIGDRCPCPTTF